MTVPKCNHNDDLIHKVSDSTDLTPYVPTKRIRPWTRAEVEAIVQARPLWVRIGSDEQARQVVVIRFNGIELGCGRYLLLETLCNHARQLDGSPCGVEVEE
jgi:hypothetical protein